MALKLCNKCGESKKKTDFSKNKAKKDGLNASCKLCHSEYLKAHYEANKKYYKDRVTAKRREHQKENRAMIIALKESTPCADCGQWFPSYVMDFDHITDDKKDNISRLARYTPKVVMAEIQKCEIVCANCHRERTHARLRGLTG